MPEHISLQSQFVEELEAEIAGAPWIYPWRLRDGRQLPLAVAELETLQRSVTEMIEPRVRAALEGVDASALDLACCEGWLSHRLPDWRASRVVGIDVREAVDSSRTMFDVLEAFEEIDLAEPLTGYLGERPAPSVKKWTLRRVPTTTLSHCGETAPGLDVVARRFDRLAETGTNGAYFDWSVGESVVERVADGAPILRPVFEPGDALLFDNMFLHRTAADATMTQTRYAIESWFFAPSRYPNDQVPLVF
jgi:hypothetical protein